MEKLNVAEIIELITLSQLVNHCTNRSLRTKALKDGLSLKDFLKNARAYETAEQQTKEIDSGNIAEVREVNSGRGRSQSRPRYKARHRSKSGAPKGEKKCFRCGGKYPHDTSCPAMRKKCNKCHKVGHFDIVCRNKNINVHKVTDVSDDEYIGSVITDISALRTDTKSADVYIGSNKLQVLIDTGARVNIMNKSTYLSIPEAQGRLLEPDRTLYPYGANSNPLKIIGRLKVKLKSQHTGKLVRTFCFPY
jgi:hypothetical protein